MFGFAKLRGFSPWPAQKTGLAQGKVWVKYFGCGQLGTVPHKNWTDLTPDSYEKIGLKKSKLSGYSKALEDMIRVSKYEHTSTSKTSSNEA